MQSKPLTAIQHTPALPAKEKTKSEERWPSSDETCRIVAKETGGRAIVLFSRGKDSIATWLQMRRFFKHITPVFRYTVPGMKFEEESLAYFEDFFKCHIYRIPHVSLYRWLRYNTYQSPERAARIREMNIKVPSYIQQISEFREAYGLEGQYAGIGIRSMDNLTRRMAIASRGVIHAKTLEFYPIHDWSKADVLDAIRESGCKLPDDYHWFGCSFDGIEARYINGLRLHSPEDYAKVLEWFPMIESDLMRRGLICYR